MAPVPAASVQTVDYTIFEDGIKESIAATGAEFQDPAEKDKFSYAFVAPRGQVLLRGKESDTTQDMSAAAIGKCRAVVEDKSEVNLIDPRVKYGGCGLCCVFCCMLPPVLCCNRRFNVKGAVPVKMDGGEIGSFATAGSNYCERDREVAVKALTAVGFTEEAGVFSRPSTSA
jgi:hypothetical protein